MASIGVGIIVRNAEKSIKDCLESLVGNVDQIVVVMAGKTDDNTLEEIKKVDFPVEIYDLPEIAEPQWVKDILGDYKGISDFSVARNLSFSKLKTDWAVWVDADDFVYQAENMRHLVNDAAPEVGAIWFPYHYALDEWHNVTMKYERERLFRRSFHWIWRDRLHETGSPLNGKCQFVRTDEVIFKHNHLVGQDRGERNFKLLEIMSKEDPKNKRIWLYLGHQHFACGNWMDAAEWYLKYGTDQQTIPIERYQALCYGSRAMLEMQDRQAIDVALMAISLYPNYRDAYLEMARGYLHFGDTEKCLQYIKLAEVKDIITDPPNVIFNNPLDSTFNKYGMLAECYIRKKQFKEALVYLQLCHQIQPTVQDSINYVNDMMMRDRVVDSMKTLAVHLLDRKQLVQLKHLPHLAPAWFRDSPDYKQIKKGVEHYTGSLKDEPEIVEHRNSVVANLAKSLNPKELLQKLDKYDKVTLIAPFPSKEIEQINVFSQSDLENLVTAIPGHNLINLHRDATRIICEYDKRPQTGMVIRMYLGPGLEYWSPETIAHTGCGGSETAMARLAEELCKKGHISFVYAMDNQVWDRVIYRTDYNPHSLPCDLFISSRVPEVFNEDIPAKQKWLWMHDVHSFDRLTPELAERIDCIVCLSQWHVEHIKRVYPWLKNAEVIDLDKNVKTYDDLWTAGVYYPDAVLDKLPKIAIIGNGIRTKSFKHPGGERHLHRFIWASSPDRGLEQLLAMWSLIKKTWADAELKIFYGWEYFDKSLFLEGQRQIKEKLRKLIRQDGVKWCGRVGQYQLVEEMFQAGILLYPPPHDFRETYGIIFLEAQAAGVLCAYRQNGALGETIGTRGVPLKLDAKPEEIVEAIVKTLHDTERYAILKKRARKYAMSRDWSKQAEKVEELYKVIENDKNRFSQSHSI